MTPREIKAFARKVSNDLAFTGKTVAIKREDGAYFAPHGQWTSELAQAQAFHYDRERVGEQLAQVEQEYGAKWEAVEHPSACVWLEFS